MAAVPTFEDVAPIDRALESQAQSTLADGRVLVTGGVPESWEDDDGPVKEARLYDPATDRWTTAASMSRPREGHFQTTLANGFVLVCSRGAELYDPASDRWTAVASRQNSWIHSYPGTASTLADGRVLVCGSTSYRMKEKVEIYDPNNDRWSPAAPMPGPMDVHGAHTQSTLADGRVLVIGKDSNEVGVMYTYDPAEDSWAEMPLEADYVPVGSGEDSQTTLADGRVLVVGREVSAIYTPATNSWARGPDLPSRLYSHTASPLKSGNVLLVGNVQHPDPERPLSRLGRTLLVRFVEDEDEDMDDVESVATALHRVSPSAHPSHGSLPF